MSKLATNTQPVPIFTQKLLICGLLIILIWLVYAQTLNYGFIFLDDFAYIIYHPQVQSGLNLANIKWALINTDTCLWMPLTWLSFMLDATLFGPTTKGYHFTNTLLYSFNGLLLFVCLYKASKNLWCSGIATALFTMHPLRVESVAWIAERKDVLSGLFLLLTLYSYISYTHKASRSKYVAIIVGYALALMAKPIVVTLPVMLLLLDYWPLQRLSLTDLTTTIKQLGQLLKEKIPIFLITLIFCLFQMQLSRETGCTRIDYPLKLRLSNAVISYVAYLKMTFWPRNLAVFYPYQTTIPLTQVMISILILLTISVIALVYIKKYPFLIVGWGWFLATLLPNIGIIQMGEQARADRFSYIAHIGLMIMIVWLVATISAKLLYHQALLTIISTSLIMILATLSWLQAGFWQNSRTLFEYTLSATSNNVYIHNNFAIFLVFQHEIDEAEKHFRDALNIEPWNNVSRKNLAYVLDVKGLKSEAQQQLAIAQSIDEATPKPNIDADDFINIGASLYRHNFIEESQRYYLLASQADPKRPEPYLQLGNILRSQNRLPEAVETYHKALQLKPDYAEVYNNLGVALAQQQQYVEAQQQFTLALKYKPDYLGAQENLAKVVAILKDTK